MSLWSGYAVWVLPTVQLYVANFSGVVLPFTYLCFFAFHSRGAARARIVATTTLLLAAAWLIVWGIYAMSGSPSAVSIGGGVTVACNCAFFVAPLRKLREAITLRDLRHVPVTLSIVQFFQGLTWIIAAFLLRDNFILGVNAAGWGFAILQLCVILYVKRRGPAQVAADGEAGPKALVLVNDADAAAASAPESAEAAATAKAAVSPPAALAEATAP